MSVTNENSQIPQQGESTWGGSVPTNYNLPKLKEAADKGDPTAQELLSLMQARSDLESRFSDLKKESSLISTEISQSKINLERVNNFIIGVVIALAVAFCFLLFDLLKDKDLYSNYNGTYKSLIDKSVEQDLKIKDVENQLELLKAKNYLK